MAAAQADDVAVIDAGVDALDEAEVDDMVTARPEEYRDGRPPAGLLRTRISRDRD